jgi:hypothetical protein
VDTPTITMLGRKWSDGHVTLMKAYDDGSEERLQVTSLGIETPLHVELGQAASNRLVLDYFETGDVPTQEQRIGVVGWPPGTTTNRPPAPTNWLQFAASALGFGLDVAADFTDWGVSHVTIQLWNGGALIGESVHAPAAPGLPLVTLDALPTVFDQSAVGEWRLSGTNPVVVISGLDCGGAPCIGTELRILAEIPPEAHPPVAFTEMLLHLSDGMDLDIRELATLPACATGTPLRIVAAPGGTRVSWDGDGFMLQGAETSAGPWHDLGDTSPVNVSIGSPLRVFRLRCR